MPHLGPNAQDMIDWTVTRLICIAADFTKYDEHAVQPDRPQHRTHPLTPVWG